MKNKYSLSLLLEIDKQTQASMNRGMSGDKTRVGGAAGQYVCVGVMQAAGFTAGSNKTSSGDDDVWVKGAGLGKKTHYIEAKSGDARFDLGEKTVKQKLAGSSAIFMCDSSINKNVIICYDKTFFNALKAKKVPGIIDMSANDEGRTLTAQYVVANNNARGDHKIKVSQLLKVAKVKKGVKTIDAKASAKGIQLTVQAEMGTTYQATRREYLAGYTGVSANRIKKLQLGMIGRHSAFPGCTVANKDCSYPFLPTMGERANDKNAIRVGGKKPAGFSSVKFGKTTYHYNSNSFKGSSGNGASALQRRGEAACAYVHFCQGGHDNIRNRLQASSQEEGISSA